MRVYEKDGSVYVSELFDFNLKDIFDSGQCFRWNLEADGTYTGVAFGKILNVSYCNNSLRLEGSSLKDYEKIWKKYFDIERDYSKIKELLSKNDSIMKEAVAYGGGMRILKQEKWETLISFIISQNNNIPRIKKCIETLCINHGEHLGEYKGKDYYSFPTYEKLAAIKENELDLCRFGYRASYIYNTAKKIQSIGIEGLENLDNVPTCEALDYLKTFPGVGPKVANCITLFSMGKYDSFPIDVWVKRLMHELYNIEEGNFKKMIEYADSHFGNYGGIAQQYLFYYVREKAQKKE